VYPDLGLYGVAFYMMARAAAMQAYEPHEVWRRVNHLRAGSVAGTEGEARA
jgi:hypothetical protein